MPPKLKVSEPYPGPRPFSSHERRIFFGRDEEISDLCDLSMSYQVVVLYSQSGAGKSSLVRAGLRPELLRRRIRMLPLVRIGGTADGNLDGANIYINNMLAALFGKRMDPTKSLAEHLHQDNQISHQRSIILFDQFEELFTAYLDRWKEREVFLSQVKDALRADPELRCLFIIREERLAELDAYSEIIPTNFRIRYRLERLKEDAALLAIQRPPQTFGWSVQDEDAQKLVANLRQIRVTVDTSVRTAEGEYIEPVHLQVVCQDIWRRRNETKGDKVLRVPDDVQDIDRALSTYYDTAVKTAASEGCVKEQRIRRWFARELITPRGTRGFVYRGVTATEGLPNKALDILEREHIVRSEPRAGESWYELTHDRFIAPITHSNRQWRKRRRRVRLPLYLIAAFLVAACLRILIPWGIGVYKQRQAVLAAEGTLKAEAEAMEASEALQKRKVDDSRRKLKSALQYYNDAESHYVRSKLHAPARFYAEKGDALRQTGDLIGSQDAYRKAISLAEAEYSATAKSSNSVTPGVHIRGISAGSNPADLQPETPEEAVNEQARDHRELGRVYFQAGDTERGIKELKTTLPLLSSQNDTIGRARVESLLAEAYLRKGNFDKAEFYYLDSIANVDAVEQTPEAFYNTLGVAMVHGQKGNYLQGLREFRAFWSLQGEGNVFQKLQLPALMLREVAFDELHLWHFDLALKYLNSASDKAKNAGDLEQQANVSLLFAEYYLELEELAGTKIIKSQSQVSDDLKAGIRAARIDMVTDSRESAEHAYNLFRDVSNPVMAGTASIYLGRADIELGVIDKEQGRYADATIKFKTAHAELEKALDWQKRAERKIGEAYTLQAFAVLAEAEEKPETAMNYYTESYCIYKQIGVSLNHLHLKEVEYHLKLHQVDFAKSTFIAQQCPGAERNQE
jgi:hypothetical protein